jgi:hypothetical protein
MHCHEARKRIAEARGVLSESGSDSQLLEHIRQCPECALFVRAERLLQCDLDTVRIDDYTDIISFSALKASVEARAGLASSDRHKENNVMGKVVRQLRRRPRLGTSIAVALVLLAIITLVPFSFERTVGYEVAIAGVNKNLAMDSDKIQELLNGLGVGDAVVNVGDCENTCVVKISELESENDVRIVTAAFDELGHCELKEVKPVLVKESSTLVNEARRNIFVIRTKTEYKPDSEVHEIVADCLKKIESESGEAFQVWATVGCGTDEETGIITGHEISADNVNTIQILATTDGKTNMTVTDVNGEIHHIDMDDENAATKLKALGLDMPVIRDSCGGLMKQLCLVGKRTSEDGTVSEPDDTPKEMDAVLPDGYALHQNYPNPFNPATFVSFNIPTSQHVTIEIFNVQGRKVKTLTDESYGPGTHTIEWDATSDAGEKVSSGMYMYRMTAGEFSATKKMTFVK